MSNKATGLERKGKKSSKSSGIQSFGQLASQRKFDKTANKDLCATAVDGLCTFQALYTFK